MILKNVCACEDIKTIPTLLATCALNPYAGPREDILNYFN